MTRPLVAVDLFAGGGGASEGIRRASGVSPVVAVNHCPAAIAMHERNHPETIHKREDVWIVRPGDAVPAREVDLLWPSPDCTTHSRAKGSKPINRDLRTLPWVVVKWAKAIMPWVIIGENVWEMTRWGPLYPDNHPDPKLRGRPIPEREGETFDEWVRAFEDLGYVFEYKELNAADYGAPTSRRRLYFIARRDGKPIVWPEPTHGPGREKPWRSAAECIDWSLPSCSIFATPDEAKAWAGAQRELGHRLGTPRRPLADATMRRIAAGLVRYVLEHPDPYIVRIGHQSSDSGKVKSVHDPLTTVTSKNEHLLVAPHLVNTRNGERKGQRPRTRSLRRPAPTITAQGSQGAVVAAHLMHHRGQSVGSHVGEPCPTLTATGQGHQALVSAFLAKHYGGPNGHATPGEDLRAPAPTMTSRGQVGPVLAELAPEEQGRARKVAAFLTAYYGQGGQHQDLREPLRTIVSKARFGLVEVELHGEPYVVTDISMRMLQPREGARCQGFGEDYHLVGSKAEQWGRIGNSVCPDVAQALVEAQFGGPGCPDLKPQPEQPSLWGWRYAGAAK